MATLSPLADRIVIKQKDAEQPRGPIVLPESAKKKGNFGEVVSVGPGRTLDSGTVVAVNIKVGDTVYYAAYSGTEIERDGQKFLVLSEGDVLAVDK
jgi:chaperonin GroES